MKKIYLLAGVLVGSFALNAQLIETNTPAVRALTKKGMPGIKSVKAKLVPKVEGTVVWSSDFSTPGDWTISNATPHTSGDWAIISTMPVNLVEQAVDYGFPDEMNSASGGNFALVNSDAAGGTGVQNAFLTTAATIDLSAYGDSAFYVKFTEIYRHFYDENYLQVSNDGGATWTEFAVNPVSEVAVNTNSEDPEYEIINITAANGGAWSANVKIRFRYVGAWDWFWGIDDVELVQANENDIKVTNVFQKTPVGTQELDYYTIDNSQASFPGLVFKALFNNFGNADQDDVNLRVTAPALSYDETSASISMDRGQVDSIEVLTPLIIPPTVGAYTINLTTEIAGETDADVANNQKSMVVNVTEHLYGRDNGVMTGDIGNLLSQPGSPLKIGNLMEIFNDIDVTNIQVRLTDQEEIVDQEMYATIFLFNTISEEFENIAQSENIVLTEGDMDTWVSFPLEGGVTLNAGDLIILMAGHMGGEDEIRFAMAQPVEMGTVLGFTDDGERFQLIDPAAIMIRLSDEPSSLGLAEKTDNFGLNVYPNPANDKVTVDFRLNNETAVNMTVTDLTGKVVYTSSLGSKAAGAHSVSINTATLTNGVYMINFGANNAVSTQKLVIKK